MDYSISIRTLGRSPEKLERLVDSIKKLSIKPKETIFVIAKGYELPKIDLENKRVVYSEKGMFLQRVVGVEEAKTEYVLLLDDDIEFDENLVKELYQPIKEKKCDISFPIYKGLLLNGGAKSLISAFTCSSVPNKKNKTKFVEFMDTGGFRYNSNLDKSDKYLYSQSAPGMCVFGKTSALKKINLRDELWIDKVGYALREDAVLIYKAFLENYKIIGVQGIKIEHLDAGSSEKNRNLKEAYAQTYNHILFWKRFIYGYKKSFFKKLKAKICLTYWIFATRLYTILKLIIKRDFEIFKTSLKGMKDGVSFIRSRKDF